jgi:transposase
MVQDLPWTILHPSRDARTPEMVAFDQAMDGHLVETLNGTDTFRRRLRSSRGPIAALRHSASAFASLHFDPIRPAELTDEEKKALELYLTRGRSKNPTAPTG